MWSVLRFFWYESSRQHSFVCDEGFGQRKQAEGEKGENYSSHSHSGQKIRVLFALCSSRGVTE